MLLPITTFPVTQTHMSETEKGTLDFHHIKSPDFKTGYASGLFANLTPNGLINLTFYIDRNPIPDLISFNIEDGKLGQESNKITRKGIVREVQHGVLVDVNTLKNVITVLEQALKMHQSQLEQIASSNTNQS